MDYLRLARTLHCRPSRLHHCLTARPLTHLTLALSASYVTAFFFFFPHIAIIPAHSALLPVCHSSNTLSLNKNQPSNSQSALICNTFTAVSWTFQHKAPTSTSYAEPWGAEFLLESIAIFLFSDVFMLENNAWGVGSVESSAVMGQKREAAAESLVLKWLNAVSQSATSTVMVVGSK